MQRIQKGWVVVGVAVLVGLQAIGTMAAPGTGDTPPALAPQESPTGPAVAPPQSWYEAVAERVHVGGYGSFRYETNDLQEFNNSFNFRRFVLTLDARPAPRLHFNFELEFERFTVLELEREINSSSEGIEIEQALEGSNDSELRIEQVWAQYDIVPWLNFRAGALLMPVGRFNLMHDDNRWNIPRRPLVDRGVPVLPVESAWTELGAGIVGEIPLGKQTVLNYKLYVVNGVVLDTEIEEEAEFQQGEGGILARTVKLRPVNGPFDQDLNAGKAVAARISLSPSLGSEIAISGYVGDYAPDFLNTSKTVWSIAVDGKTTLGPLEIEGEYVYTHWEDVPGVAQAFAQRVQNASVANATPSQVTELNFELANLASAKSGYWLEFRYPFWPSALSQTLLGRGFANPQLVPVMRWEQVFFHKLLTDLDFTNGDITVRRTRNATLNRFTIGFAYRPTPLWVFSLAYERTFTSNDSGSLAGLTNFLPAQPDEKTANAFLVGIAFGF
jgi:hypothetical protein